MLPFLEVAHLPSSTSFYSAIVQPLGLQYLSADSTSSPHSLSPACTNVAFGVPSVPPKPIFEVRQLIASTARPLKVSRIQLTASSPEVVSDFHAFAVRAFPELLDDPAAAQRHFLRHSPESGSSISGANNTTNDSRTGGESCAKITDFDGNIMEVAYRPSMAAHYPPPSRYNGRAAVRETDCTESEVSRILDWNYDVASSAPPSSAGGRPAALTRRPAASRSPPSGDGSYTVISKRSFSQSTAEPSPRQNSSGVSTSTLVSSVLGAAALAGGAAAALTYSMVKNDRSRAPAQEFDAPPFTRRATYPDPGPDRKDRYVEVKRTVEEVRWPDNYAPFDNNQPHQGPRYVARYSQVGAPTVVSKSREDDDVDYRSRHSTRYHPGSSAARSARARSEDPMNRKPMMIADRSYVSSRHSTAAPPRSSVGRSVYEAERDRESHVSRRSQRSASTARPPSVLVVPQPPPAPRSRSGTSHVSARTITMPEKRSPPRSSLSRNAKSYVSAKNYPLPPSEVSGRSARHYPLPPSEASARHHPLPASGVGSSHADWDDDLASLAPSDSISCVGSSSKTKKSRKRSDY